MPRLVYNFVFWIRTKFELSPGQRQAASTEELIDVGRIDEENVRLGLFGSSISVHIYHAFLKFIA